MTCDDNDPRDAILKLLEERDASKTICPSEAARAIGGEDWRDLMPTVHAAARALAEEGIVELRQGGESVGTEGIVGPYRIARLGGKEPPRTLRNRCPNGGPAASTANID